MRSSKGNARVTATCSAQWMLPGAVALLALACGTERVTPPHSDLTVPNRDVVAQQTVEASLDIEKVTGGGIGTFDFAGTGTGVTASFTRATSSAGVVTTTAPMSLNDANSSGDKFVQETPVPTGWTITNITCTDDGATVVIGRGGSAAFADGGGAGFQHGDNTVKVTLAPGSDPSCTFTNTRDSRIDIEKISTGGTGQFDFVEEGTCLSGGFSRTTTTDGIVTTSPDFVCPAPFSDQFIQENTAAGWEIASIQCTSGTFVIGRGTGASFVNGGTAGYDNGDNSVRISLGAGVTNACTFTNKKTAALAIQKITRGAAGGPFAFVGTGADVPANFTRTTAAANVATSASAFAIASANLGVKYVQETVLAGWTITGISCTAGGGSFVIGKGGSVAFTNGGSDGFDPGDNTVQVNVTDTSNPTCTFENTAIAPPPPPPSLGQARGIGYWKNHSSCTAGQQFAKATENDNLEGTLDFYLGAGSQIFPIGLIVEPLECVQAVNLLNRDSLNGDKRPGDPIYNLVAQLLAARLNRAAGAVTCPALNVALNDAQTLLLAVQFDGSKSYAGKGASFTLTADQRAEANRLSGILSSYNEGALGALCPGHD